MPGKKTRLTFVKCDVHGIKYDNGICQGDSLKIFQNSALLVREICSQNSAYIPTKFKAELGASVLVRFQSDWSVRGSYEIDIDRVD